MMVFELANELYKLFGFTALHARCRRTEDALAGHQSIGLYNCQHQSGLQVVCMIPSIGFFHHTQYLLGQVW